MKMAYESENNNGANGVILMKRNGNISNHLAK
jgi:hypothetical protein